jgi:hypothetical protein
MYENMIIRNNLSTVMGRCHRRRALHETPAPSGAAGHIVKSSSRLAFRCEAKRFCPPSSFVKVGGCFRRRGVKVRDWSILRAVTLLLLSSALSSVCLFTCDSVSDSSSPTHPVWQIEFFLSSWLSLRQSRNYPPFMESEGSLSCSREPATGPCPEPDISNPHLIVTSVIKRNKR